MRRYHIYGFLILLVPGIYTSLPAQEINYDSLLQRVDTIENPVYKPVIGLTYGVLTFRGDVNNNYSSALLGNPAGGINIATFIDRKHYFVANFNFMVGRISGNERSYSDINRNLNFQTDLYAIGINAEYRFGHLIPGSFPIRPYITLGIENITFSSKGDLYDGSDRLYYYWTDGTIRDRPESASSSSTILYRDYVYETDLRLREQQLFNLGEYSQRTLGFPLGIGVHFDITDRAYFSLGLSYHYTLTDYIDNVAYEGTSVSGGKGNDSYIYSQFSLHFDLFSEPEIKTVDLLYADVDYDPLFFDDEDGDFVLDIADRCPGTPYGVEVDTLGCPLDTDDDGVPDYRDQEANTASGAWVDEEGRTITEEQFRSQLEYRTQAMARADVPAYLEMIKDQYVLAPTTEIPEKFKDLDTDGDGYLSFEELLKAIDDYFDYKLQISIEELRDVNEFFFSQ